MGTPDAIGQAFTETKKLPDWMKASLTVVVLFVGFGIGVGFALASYGSQADAAQQAARDNRTALDKNTEAIVELQKWKAQDDERWVHVLEELKDNKDELRQVKEILLRLLNK